MVADQHRRAGGPGLLETAAAVGEHDGRGSRRRRRCGRRARPRRRPGPRRSGCGSRNTSRLRSPARTERILPEWPGDRRRRRSRAGRWCSSRRWPRRARRRRAASPSPAPARRRGARRRSARRASAAARAARSYGDTSVTHRTLGPPRPRRRPGAGSTHDRPLRHQLRRPRRRRRASTTGARRPRPHPAHGLRRGHRLRHRPARTSGSPRCEAASGPNREMHVAFTAPDAAHGPGLPRRGRWSWGPRRCTSRGSGRSTTRATTARSSATPTATTSRRSATRASPGRLRASRLRWATGSGRGGDDGPGGVSGRVRASSPRPCGARPRGA